MQDFFSTLPIELKSFFENYDFIPKNKNDVNNFIKNKCGLFSHSNFEVECENFKVNNKNISKVLIYKDFPFDAYIEPVWNSMSFEQRIKAIDLTISYFIDKDKLLKNSKIDVEYYDELYKDKKSFGFYSDKNNSLFINAINILNGTNSLELLKTIIHELVHARQSAFAEQNKKNKASLDNMSEYEKTIIRSDNKVKKYFAMMNYMGIEKYNTLLKNAGDFSGEDIENLKMVFYSNNEQVNILKYLLYVTNPIESAAFFREHKVVNKIVKSLNGKYGDNVVDNLEDDQVMEALDSAIMLGYDLYEEDVEILGKISADFCDIKNQDLFLHSLKCIAKIYKSKTIPEEVLNDYGYETIKPAEEIF